MNINIICVLSIFYTSETTCVCIVILSKMVDDVTRGRRMVECKMLFLFSLRNKELTLLTPFEL